MSRGALLAALVAPSVVACSLLTDLDAIAPNPVDAGTDVRDSSAPPDTGPRMDSSPADTSVPDSADAAVVCDPLKPFTSMTAIAELNSSSLEEYPRLSKDELTIYFNSTSSGSSHNLYVATRSSPSMPFSGITALASLNTGTYSESAPTLSSDGLVIFFVKWKVASKSTIMTAVRGSTLSPFGAPSASTDLNSLSDDDTPFLAADDSEIWLTYDNTGDLYRATKNGQGFTMPVAVSELDTGAVESAPVLSADKLTIYFSRGYMSYVAHRTSPSDPFSTPSAVTEINKGTETLPGWLSSDDCRLYFFSDSAGNEDLYVASRNP